MTVGLGAGHATRLATAILVATCIGFCVAPAVDTSSILSSGSNIASFGLYTCALTALQAGYFGRLQRYPGISLRYVAILVQACLVYLPILQYGEAWLTWPSFLAGSLLVSLRPAVALPMSVAVVISAGWLQSRFSGSGGDVALTVVSTVAIAVAVFGLTRFAAAVAELQSARNDLAKVAVADERIRFARDLHDLLGISLSAIILKSELTHRLISDDPAKAARELAEIRVVAQKAQADIRLLTSGHRRLFLNEECDSAESVLAAADIRVRIRRGYVELPEPTATLLATVLREGVTNVLRHSRADWCEITIVQSPHDVSFELVNNGAVTEAGRGDGDGSGLRNLSERVRVVSGTIDFEHLPDERFRLRVSLPLAASARARFPEAG